MDRDSQELRAHSPSLPPGLLVGSVVLDAAATRSRRRTGLTLVCLAVCAYCLGFAVTDWACRTSDETVAAARAETAAVALHRTRIAAPTGARASLPVAESSAPEVQPVRVAEPARREPSVTASVPAQKRTKPARAAIDVRPEQAAPQKLSEVLAASEEPSPVVTLDEVNQALALADASQRIFASVDEVVPKHVTVVPPSAATLRNDDAPRKANAVGVEDLSVDGALSSKVVNRGLQRLLPQYDRCRELSDSAPQRLKLSATIDEVGHGRRVTVEGLCRPGLRRCLEQATSHLVVPAPDTGTARARWVVRFAAR